MNIVLKRFRLLLTFYKSYALVNCIVSLAGAYTLYKASEFSTTPAKLLPAVIWMKIITTGMVVYYINTYQRKQFYYFQNLGLSKIFLWGCSLAFDFLLFTILLIFSLC